MVIGGTLTMAITRLKFINRFGIPSMETIKATLTTTGLTYTFNNHPFVHDNFQGFFVVKVSGTPSAPQSAVNVYFDTDGIEGSSVPVYNAAGTQLTTGTFPGNGVFLFFYDRTTDMLRLMTDV